MSDLKMADIWGWDCIPQDYGHYDGFTYNGKSHEGDYYGLLFSTKEAANAVSHAVKNHDRLVEEIAQLKADKAELVEVLESAISIKSLWVPIGSFSDDQPENYQEMEALHLMARDFDSLLQKHKG